MKPPVILFAYARPDHLSRTLECLQDNRVSLIYAFSDGPKTPEKASSVEIVRRMLRDIDWSEVVLCERETNLGLGRSILTGVSEVLSKHESAIVFEDDLICVPGTYEYLSAALDQYRHNDEVMSVTGWTHPKITPSDISVQPYFDGRAECWVWGTWSRAWQGMREDAKTILLKCESEGIDVYRYGADIPSMAATELQKNIWAVRFLSWHVLNRGLCLRPPWSMVEHIGFDTDATNAAEESWLKNAPLKPSPPIPEQWPEIIEHDACSRLHQKMCGARPTFLFRMKKRVRRLVYKILHPVSLR